MHHIRCTKLAGIAVASLFTVAAAQAASLGGLLELADEGSFFVNGPAGNFQDWIVNDVWNFVNANYSVRPERAAHMLSGISMGGFGAYNIAIKHRPL